MDGLYWPLEQGDGESPVGPFLDTAALEKANPDIAKKVLPAQVSDTLPALLPEGSAPLRMDTAQWDALATWMRENGLLKDGPAGSAATDSSLLPEGSK